MHVIFCILCFFFIRRIESILIGVSIQANIQHFVIQELFSIVPWLQQTGWTVCLERTEAVFDQNIFNDIHRRNGQLWLSSEDKFNNLCAFELAVTRNANEYLLLVLDQQISSAHKGIEDTFVVHQFELNSNIYYLRHLILKGDLVRCVQNDSTLNIDCIKQQKSQDDNLFAIRNTSNINPQHISPSAIEKTELEYIQPYHSAGEIQLWWPLNHTEIFIHRHVPPHLSPLRLKQKFIFVFPTYHFTNLSDQIDIRFKDYHHNNPTTVHHILLDKHSLSHMHNPKIIESSIEYYSFSSFSSVEDSEEKMREKVLSIEIIDMQSSQLLATFPLTLKIVYGTDYWQNIQSQPQPPCSFLPFHPMVGQLDSRDDLGFALSSISPNASRFVEIGVNNGHFAQLLLETWDTLRTYIGIDPWKTWSEEVYYDLANAVDQGTHNQHYFNTKMRLAPYGDRVLLIRKTSAEAAEMFVEESVDVVYIDAQHHYTAVMEDMNLWWPKIRRGGLLCGHDHLLDVLDNTIFTVKPAVEAFARKHHLLVLQTYDDMKPSFPTWMLFKPQ